MTNKNYTKTILLYWLGLLAALCMSVAAAYNLMHPASPSELLDLATRSGMTLTAYTAFHHIVNLLLTAGGVVASWWMLQLVLLAHCSGR